MTHNDTSSRRLAAILAADVVGFSRLMGQDEEATLSHLKQLRAELIDPAIAAQHGRIFKTTGDGLLVEFPSVVAAVECAAHVQQAMARLAATDTPAQRMLFRVGINVGDVIVDADDLYGDGVNIAARLQTLCEPGGIAIAANAYEQVRDKVALRFTDCGEHLVKNIARPLHVYAVDLGPAAANVRAAGQKRRPDWPRRLAWLVGACMVVAVVGLGWRWAKRPVPGVHATAPRGATGELPSVAVLPFANQSGDTEHDYFAEGVSEDVINALGRYSGLRVMSPSAVLPYKGRRPTPAELSRELRVRYIVQGSVRQAADRLRVVVELSDAEKGTLLWSQYYDGSGQQVFEIQDRVVTNLVGALAVQVTEQEQQRAVAKPAQNLAAYDLVLRAREKIQHYDRTANREARTLLAEAQRLAPNYAEVYLGLAEAENQRLTYGWVEDMEAAVRHEEEDAQHALAIDDPGANARAHAVLGNAYSVSGRYEAALTEVGKAISLNASDETAYATRGDVLLYLGRIDDSIASLETAWRFNPRLSPGIGFDLALGYYTAGRYRDALATADAFLQRQPQVDFLHAIRAATLAQLGQLDEAQREARETRRLNPVFDVDAFGSRFQHQEHRVKLLQGLRRAGM